MSDVIGIVGVGRIGLTMASMLIEAGYIVIGYRRGTLDDLIAIGGRAAVSPRELAEAADIIVTCVPDSAALGNVLAGENGLLAGVQEGRIIVETSTMLPSEKREHCDTLAAAGAILLDCPVNGTPEMLRMGRGAFFASGEQASFQKVRPLLETIAARTTYVGDVGAGSIVKSIANMLVPIHVAAAAEMLTFATRSGVDAETVIDAISGSPASSAMFEMRGAMMAKRDYSRGGTLAGFNRNFATLVAVAGTLGGDYPVLRATADLYSRAIAEGYGDKDQSVLFDYLLSKG